MVKNLSSALLMRERGRAISGTPLFLFPQGEMLSDSGLDVPHEGSESQLVTLFVELVKTLKHSVDTAVFHYRYDGLRKRRPGVRPVVGLAVLAAAARRDWPCREPAAVQTLKIVDYIVVMGLVECYEYRFHFVSFEL